MKFATIIAVVALPVALFHLATGEELRLSDSRRPDPTTARSFHEIRGTERRQNPVRRSLAEPYSGDTLFVRFRLRYAADTLDAPPEDEGEFAVLWLDRIEGNETSSHSGGVPNVGIHVDDEGANRFMVRYASRGEVFGPELEGDRETTVVARLAKSSSGSEQPFDELSLWIDPEPESLGEPEAVARSAKALSTIRWIGFSTGRKTEPEDRILVGDLRLAEEWAGILGAPAPPEVTEIPAPPEYEPPEPPAKIAEVEPPPEEVTTDHWSFRPVRRPEIPETSHPDWVRTPVDAFVARKHGEAGLSPAPPADDATLARRLSLVLTGLPPGPDFPAGDPDRAIEALLDSTAYGERWGRHWLDVARWAESNGHQHNRDRPHAWRYRDWVVEAFAEDQPFDAFLRQQIAGDEMESYDPDHLVATGFLAAARYSGNELDQKIQRNDILVDIVNTTSKAFLGLTMECAQCHDHFFDPVTQWDYYRLMACFAQGQPGDVILSESDERAGRLVRDYHGLFESVRSRLEEKKRARGAPEPVLVIPKSVVRGMTAAEKRTFTRLEKKLAELPKAWAFHSPVTSPHDLTFAPFPMRWPLPFQEDSLESVAVRFLKRGNVTAPGPVAEPAWPAVFGETPPGELDSRPRLALADWLTDPAHPLTARVWVNRIWQWHFGRGLVETSGDFGVAGSEPTHPELLDWLARELIESGWSTGHVHRLILRSNTFRQSSQFSAANAGRDPDNALLWRWTPRRLEAEAIRDSVLAVTGSLDREAGGPGVPLADAPASTRRSLYLHQRRQNLPHQQQLFDGADAVTSCARRRVSTVALQPLWMLNSPFMQRQVAALAARVEAEATPEDGHASAARRLVKTGLRREATAEEVADLAELIAETDLEAAAAVVLNTNEFVYLP